jgi:hypothetical protein
MSGVNKGGAMEAKEYHISSLEDCHNIPAEKLGAFLLDFGTWLDMCRKAQEINETSERAFGVGGALELGRFTWIDDDIRGVSGVDLTDGEQIVAKYRIEGAQA